MSGLAILVLSIVGQGFPDGRPENVALAAFSLPRALGIGRGSSSALVRTRSDSAGLDRLHGGLCFNLSSC